MIGVDKIEDIRRRARGGESIASIARAVGVNLNLNQPSFR